MNLDVYGNGTIFGKGNKKNVSCIEKYGTNTEPLQNFCIKTNNKIVTRVGHNTSNLIDQTLRNSN